MVSPPDPEPTTSDSDAHDWTAQVTDLVTDSVDKVRARTTGPLMGIAHGLIYALVAAIVAIPVIVLLSVGLMRLLNWAVPGDVWISYLIIAVCAWIGGLILWTRRQPSDAR